MPSPSTPLTLALRSIAVVAALGACALSTPDVPAPAPRIAPAVWVLVDSTRMLDVSTLRHAARDTSGVPGRAVMLRTTLVSQTLIEGRRSADQVTLAAYRCDTEPPREAWITQLVDGEPLDPHLQGVLLESRDRTLREIHSEDSALRRLAPTPADIGIWTARRACTDAVRALTTAGRLPPA